MTEVVTLNGKLINIGPWDECIVSSYIQDNPYKGDLPPPDDWDYQHRKVETVTNPLPVGAILEEREVIESGKGRLLLKEDYEALREDAYPSIKDQLDAFWKGGNDALEMQALIQSIKDRFPKP